MSESPPKSNKKSKPEVVLPPKGAARAQAKSEILGNRNRDGENGPESEAKSESGPRPAAEASASTDFAASEAPPPSISPVRARPSFAGNIERRIVPPSVKYAEMFRIYDTDNDNSIDHASMVAAFGQLNLLEMLNPRLLGEILGIPANEHATRPRTYSLHNFIANCTRLAAWQARHAREHRIRIASRIPGIPRGAEQAELLRRVYGRFAVGPGQGRLVTEADFGDQRMMARQLQRALEEMGLLQPKGPLTSVSVDLTFAKVKQPGSRKMNYQQFLRALAAVQEECGSGVDVWGAANELGRRLGRQAPPPMEASFGGGLEEEDPGTYVGLDFEDEMISALPRLPHPPGGGDDRFMPFRARSKYYEKLVPEEAADGVPGPLPPAALTSRSRTSLLAGANSGGLAPLPREAFVTSASSGDDVASKLARQRTGGASMPQAPSNSSFLCPPLRPVRAFETNGDAGDLSPQALLQRLQDLERQLQEQRALLEAARAVQERTAFAEQMADAANQAAADAALAAAEAATTADMAAADANAAMQAADEAGASVEPLEARVKACEDGLAEEHVTGTSLEARVKACEDKIAAIGSGKGGAGSGKGNEGLEARLKACEKGLSEERASGTRRDAELEELRKKLLEAQADWQRVEGSIGTVAATAAQAALQVHLRQQLELMLSADGGGMLGELLRAHILAIIMPEMKRMAKDRATMPAQDDEGAATAALAAAAAAQAGQAVLAGRVDALESALRVAEEGAAAARAAADAAADRAEKLQLDVATAAAAASAAAAAAAATAATVADANEAEPAGDASSVAAAAGAAAAAAKKAQRALKPGAATDDKTLARLAAALEAALILLNARVQMLRDRMHAAGTTAAMDAETAAAAASMATAAAEAAAAASRVAAAGGPGDRHATLEHLLVNVDRQLALVLINIGKLTGAKGAGAGRGYPNGTPQPPAGAAAGRGSVSGSPGAGAARRSGSGASKIPSVGAGAGVAAGSGKSAAAGAAAGSIAGDAASGGYSDPATEATLAALQADVAAVQSAIAMLKDALLRSVDRDASSSQADGLLRLLQEQLDAMRRELASVGGRATEALEEAKIARVDAATAAAGHATGSNRAASAAAAATAAMTVAELQAMREAVDAANALSRAAADEAAAAMARVEALEASLGSLGDAARTATAAAEAAAAAALGAREAARTAADNNEQAYDALAAEVTAAVAEAKIATADTKVASSDARTAAEAARAAIDAAKVANGGAIALITVAQGNKGQLEGASEAGAEGKSAVSVDELQRRLEEIARQLAAASERAEEAHSLANGALQAAGLNLGTRSSPSLGLKNLDSSLADRPSNMEHLDARVSAATEQSSSAFSQVRVLSEKLTAVELQLTTLTGGASAAATAKQIADLEGRLTKELGEALQELIGQAQDLDALRLRVQKLEEGAASGAAKDGVNGKDGAEKFVTTAEMQEVLDAVAAKMEAQGKQLKALQRVTDGLMADLQEAAHDVGQMTVQLKQLQEGQDKLTSDISQELNSVRDQLREVKERIEVLTSDTLNVKRTLAAPGNRPHTSVALARTGGPSPGVVPPGNVDMSGAAPWEAVMAADEAARNRDMELDQGIHEMTERLVEAEKGFRIKQDTLQQILLKIARQVDRIQNHINKTILEEGGLTGDVGSTSTIIQANRAPSVNTLARLLGSHTVSRIETTSVSGNSDSSMQAQQQTVTAGPAA